jgi:peptide/nickel transport system substrate-binding protein
MSKTTLRMRGMLSSSHPDDERAREEALSERPKSVLARHTFGLALLFAVAAAVSCGRVEKASGPPRDILYRHLLGDPATLDPVTTTEEQALLVEEMIFRPLIGFDAERNFVPALALSWTASPDGTTYTFKLDPAARWEDGSAVTSDDVRFTLDRILDPKVPALSWRAALEDLAAIETPDATTVVVRFSKVYAERLWALAIPIVSAKAHAKDPAAADRKPMGSGPYRLESWQANTQIVLARRDDAAGVPFRQVVFKILPDATVAYRAGQRGELHEFRVLRTLRASAEASPEFTSANQLLKVPQFLQVMVLWNQKVPALSDPRVRLALARAWDRHEAARALYPPDGASLISGPYPPGAAENAPDVSPEPHDPAGAARLLEDSGWRLGKDGKRRKGGKLLTLELAFPAAQAISAQIAEILRAGYAKVGVELVARPLEWAALSERTDAGEFEAFLMARLFLPPNLDPYPYFHSSQRPPNGQNLGFYKNLAADALMEKARLELDVAKRRELYHGIHRILAADPPADFLWGADQYWGVSKSVDGVVVSPVGLFHFLPGPLGWRPAAP